MIINEVNKNEVNIINEVNKKNKSKVYIFFKDLLLLFAPFLIINDLLIGIFLLFEYI